MKLRGQVEALGSLVRSLVRETMTKLHGVGNWGRKRIHIIEALSGGGGTTRVAKDGHKRPDEMWMGKVPPNPVVRAKRGANVDGFFPFPSGEILDASSTATALTSSRRCSPAASATDGRSCIICLHLRLATGPGAGIFHFLQGRRFGPEAKSLHFPTANRRAR